MASKNILILGGGFAGIEVLKRIQNRFKKELIPNNKVLYGVHSQGIVGAMNKLFNEFVYNNYYDKSFQGDT